MSGLKNMIWRGVQLVIRLGSRVLIRLLASLAVEGRENFRTIPEGPLLIVANHKSYYDPVVIATALPFFSRFNPLRFIAKDEFFQSPLSAFIFKLMGAFPAHQGEGINTSLRLPEEILKENGTVVFFPEGKCVRDDSLGPPKMGAAVLCKQVAGLVVLPIAITDSHKIASIFRRPKVRIKVGQHFRVPEGLEVEGASGMIMEKIAELYRQFAPTVIKSEPEKIRINQV